MFSVALAAIVVFSLARTIFLQRRLAESTRSCLADEASVTAAALDDAMDDTTLLTQLKLEDTRITLVGTDGTIALRQRRRRVAARQPRAAAEIAQAMRSGTGASKRASSTLGEVMIYEAVRPERRHRGAPREKEQEGLLSVFVTLVGPVAALAGVALIVALVTARREARAIIAPLTLVDLDHPRRSVDNAYAEMPHARPHREAAPGARRQMAVLADNDRMRREFTANITLS